MIKKKKKLTLKLGLKWHFVWKWEIRVINIYLEKPMLCGNNENLHLELMNKIRKEKIK